MVKNIKLNTTILLLSWTLVLAAILVTVFAMHYQDTIKLAVHEAEVYYRLNLQYRAWNSRLGGVYADAGKVAPNPYLSVANRDISGSDGKKYTLVNPAYMTRMVFDTQKSQPEQQVISKLTSVNPVNAVNMADAWERKSLLSFEGGLVKQAFEKTAINDKPYLRYLAPFFIEESCLKCHGNQGYKKGDVRGGISISIPLESYLHSDASFRKNLTTGFMALWLFGSFVIVSANGRQLKQAHELQSTGQKLTESVAELEAANDRLRTLSVELMIVMDSIPALVAHIDTDQRYIYVNRAYAAWVGLPKEDIRGRLVKELLDETAYNATKPYIESVLTGKAGETERTVTAGGEQRVQHISFVPQFDEKSQVIAFFAFITDITEKQRYLDTLLEKDLRHRTILQTAMDGIWVTDLQGRLLEVNETYCRMSGYSEAELLMMHISDLGLVEDRDRAALHLKKVVADGEDRFETVHRRKDGTLYHVEVSAKHVTTGDGLLVAFLRDITSAKRSNAISKTRLHLVQFSLANSLDDLLEEALNEIEKLTGSSIGFFHFVDSDQVSLTLQAGSTRTKAVFCKAGEGEKHYDFDRAGVSIDCVHLRKPVIHNDYAALAHRKEMPEGHAPIIRELAVPVFRGEKIVAVLGVGNKPCDYEEQDVETVTLVAELIWEILERKKAEQAIVEGRNRFEYLFASSPAIIYTAGRAASNGITFVSPNVQEVLGHSPGDFVDDANFWQGHLHPDDSEHILAALPMLSDQGHLSIEYRFLTKDGYYIWMHDSMRLMRDANGDPAEVIGSWIDISGIKRIEERLLESEKRFVQVAETSEEFIWEVDTTGLYTYANSVVERMFGYPPDELVGKLHFYDLFVKEDLDELTRKTFAIFDKRESIKALKNRNVHKDGRIVVVETSGSPVVDASGRLIGYRGTDVDITGKVVLEEQLRQSQKMEAIGLLAGGVAHDFNNILQVIITYCTLLKLDGKLDSQGEQQVDQILSSAKRAANLTNDLLTFGRKKNMILKKCNLNDIVQKLHKFLVRIIGEDIQLKTSCCESPLTVNVDSGQIDQILINLATNARDAMPRGGVLAITTEPVEMAVDFVQAHGYGTPGRYALITVADSGVGMDAATLAKVFEPFFTTKEQGKGTGLGLAIAYGVVKKHNGFINAYSEPGRGTVFRIYLPMQNESPDIQEELPAAEILKSGNEIILVVEDDESVQEVFNSILTQSGYSVILARDGQEGVEQFVANRDRIKLVLMDMIMPKMNGRETAERIREFSPYCRILFTSGYTADIIRDRGELDVGDDLIMKPVRPAELLSKIREMLDSPGPSLNSQQSR